MLHICVCACACACACVHVALLIQHETCMHHNVTSFVAPVAVSHFLPLSHKQHDFRERVVEHNFLYNFCLKHFSFQKF